MTRVILASLLVFSLSMSPDVESLNSLPDELSIYSSSSDITKIELPSSMAEVVLAESSGVDIIPNDRFEAILTDVNKEDILKKLDTIAINQQLYLFGYLPLFIAIFLIYIGCKWFYKTFIP